MPFPQSKSAMDINYIFLYENFSVKKVLKNVHYFQFLPLSRFPGDTAFKSPNCKTTVICAIVTTRQNKKK